ncbi:hypothetical protein [Dyella telluris]|uniref:Uncharacterized protein n=1 Tax=Dyella telluris TaxID=2763498 RepID=A0A7G8Q4J1_9GAMM|nr:hypothetical protein [Dyella telluris]QNK01699.1 hypothetical protein H8F01_00520 [Dyella telluris]
MKADEVGRREITLALRQHIADLGITKAEVKEWIKEAVQERARQTTHELNLDWIVQRVISEFNKTNGHEVKRSVVEQIVRNLNVSYGDADSVPKLKPAAGEGRW